MVLRTKVSKQESGEKSFAVIKGGFDFLFIFLMEGSYAESMFK